MGPALPDSPLAQGLAKKSGRKDPLYFYWAPRPAPSGQNVEHSRLEFGLHGTTATGLSYSNPQAPALSRLYAHDTLHLTDPVGEAYLAPDPRQEKHSLLSPFLIYII